MTKSFLFFLSLCSFFLAACTSTKDGKVINNDKSDSMFTADAIENLAPIYVVIDGDTLYLESYRLKGDYRLALYPEEDGTDESGEIAYMHCARLSNRYTNHVLACIPALHERYWLRYNGIDFDDYFVIEYANDGNYALNMSLIEKETGKIILSAPTGGYDIENQMLIYYDDDKPNQESTGVMLYDITRNKKTEIIPNTDNPCIRDFGHWTHYTIDKVTPTTVCLTYNGCETPIHVDIER